MVSYLLHNITLHDFWIWIDFMKTLYCCDKMDNQLITQFKPWRQISVETSFDFVRKMHCCYHVVWVKEGTRWWQFLKCLVPMTSSGIQIKMKFLYLSGPLSYHSSNVQINPTFKRWFQYGIYQRLKQSTKSYSTHTYYFLYLWLYYKSWSFYTMFLGIYISLLLAFY